MFKENKRVENEGGGGNWTWDLDSSWCWTPRTGSKIMFLKVF